MNVGGGGPGGNMMTMNMQVSITIKVEKEFRIFRKSALLTQNLYVSFRLHYYSNKCMDSSRHSSKCNQISSQCWETQWDQHEWFCRATEWPYPKRGWWTLVCNSSNRNRWVYLCENVGKYNMWYFRLESGKWAWNQSKTIFSSTEFIFFIANTATAATTKSTSHYERRSANDRQCTTGQSTTAVTRTRWTEWPTAETTAGKLTIPYWKYSVYLDGWECKLSKLWIQNNSASLRKWRHDFKLIWLRKLLLHTLEIYQNRGSKAHEIQNTSAK